MSLFQTLIQIQKTDNEEMNELDKNLMAISMYIYFNYDQIMQEHKMQEFLINSERVLNKFHRLHPEFNKKQIDSIFIACNLMMIICISQIF